MSARRRRPADGGPRVIVVGAGFAGLAAVKALDRAGAQVTLIDQNIYSTFQPLLYQVATGGLNPGDVAFPLRVFAAKHGAKFRHGELESIDAAGCKITLTDGTVLDYDYLVLAVGVSAAYYGVTGAAEHTVGLYTRRDAVVLRDHVLDRLDRLDAEGPGKAVNFTVVGGGATGVELAGALAELRALDDAFPEVNRADEHIRLIEMAPTLLAPFHPKLQAYALAELRRRGVDVLLNSKIREITEDRVILENGDELPSDVTVWAAGVSAPAGLSYWGLPQGRGGRIEVGPDLRVAGQDRIFATGDISLIEGQDLPQVAQPAIQTGRHAGKQIAHLIAGQPTQPFRQGHHGHHRPAQRGGRTPARRADPRHARLAGLAGTAPVLPAGRAQPAVRSAQHVLPVPDLGPRRRRDRRRRPARSHARGTAAGAAGRHGGFPAADPVSAA
jgi:NADH dehydrogenase